MAPKYFSSILCVKMSADDRGIHYASCENRTPCVFPSQVWHQLISPEAMSTDHSIYNAYVIVENVIMQVMSLNFALAQKENTSFTVDMRVIFHTNNTLNDS